MPEPGILWGRHDGIPAPVLASDLPLSEESNFQWLEDQDGLVLIGLKNDRFCLVANTHVLDNAKKTAENYLNQDIEEQLLHELKRRDGAQNLFEEMAHHDSLAVICAESIMKALRPPEGAIPLSWFQSSKTTVPQLDINEVPPMALAWRLIDIDIAEELLLCTLKIQTNAGAIPVSYAPYTPHPIIEAPKPMLAKTIETVWRVRKKDGFLTEIIPLLQRHLQWLLHHFDPKRKNIHCWKNKAEALAPDLFESDMATADLATLLITEIDAFNLMLSESSLDTKEEQFTKERNTLEHNLLDQFWNQEELAFTNAFVRDTIISNKGFSSFVPLLWESLPHNHKTNMLERIHESGKLPGGISVLSWRKSAMDDNSFPLLQQLLVFQALKISDPHGQLLTDFSRITLQGFVEWHDLSLQKEHRLPINPVTGAYIMNVQAIHQYRYHARGKITGYLFKTLRRIKADRSDLAIILVTIFTLFSSHLIFNVLKAPPPFEMLEAQMNSAYANKDTADTLANCMAIIKHYPDNADVARQLAANISILSGNFEHAEDLYQQIREKHPDSPGPMIALGLVYQLQGRFKEAENNYYEFCYIFEEIFPELVDEINDFRYLMQEGFKAPPKWHEIYRYQLMHEL